MYVNRIETIKFLVKMFLKTYIILVMEHFLIIFQSSLEFVAVVLFLQYLQHLCTSAESVDRNENTNAQVGTV